MSQNFDILIVGAGPAGATLATLIARKGFSVGLIDKTSFPRNKACAGAVILDIFEELPYLKKHQERMLECITSYGIFHSPDYKTQIKLPLKLGACLREKFDMIFVEEAAKNRVQVITNEKIISLERKIDKIDVKTKSDTYEARVVVGADGANSIIAKEAFVNSPLKRQRSYLCRVYDFPYDMEKLSAFYSDEKAFQVFAKLAGYAQTGYGWLFPKKQHICVGFGISPSENLSSQNLFLKFLQFLFSKALLPEELATKSILKSALSSRSALCPIGGLREAVSEDRVLLVGDAGGFVAPITGMGILDAVVSAKIAAKVIIKGFQEDNLAVLSEYDFLCRKRFQKPYKKALRVQKIALSPLTSPLFRIANNWLILSKKIR
ncbi:MAG: geranylgeranyl reductase family protein [Candidatus Hermodarchaeota archaeon]